MATKTFAVGTFTRDLTAAAANVATIGVGFRPKIVLFFANVPTKTAFSVGFSDGSNHYAVYDNWVGTADTYTTTSTQCIFMIHDAAGQSQGASILSLDPDGFTLAWSKSGSPTQTATIYYLAFS